MEDQTPSPAPITITTLLTRQLSDWEQFLAELQAQNPTSFQVDYCQAQIDRLQGELNTFDD